MTMIKIPCGILSFLFTSTRIIPHSYTFQLANNAQKYFRSHTPTFPPISVGLNRPFTSAATRKKALTTPTESPLPSETVSKKRATRKNDTGISAPPEPPQLTSVTKKATGTTVTLKTHPIESLVTTKATKISKSPSTKPIPSSTTQSVNALTPKQERSAPIESQINREMTSRSAKSAKNIKVPASRNQHESTGVTSPNSLESPLPPPTKVNNTEKIAEPQNDRNLAYSLPPTTSTPVKRRKTTISNATISPEPTIGPITSITKTQKSKKITDHVPTTTPTAIDTLLAPEAPMAISFSKKKKLLTTNNIPTTTSTITSPVERIMNVSPDPSLPPSILSTPIPAPTRKIKNAPKPISTLNITATAHISTPQLQSIPTTTISTSESIISPNSPVLPASTHTFTSSTTLPPPQVPKITLTPQQTQRDLTTQPLPSLLQSLHVTFTPKTHPYFKYLPPLLLLPLPGVYHYYSRYFAQRRAVETACELDRYMGPLRYDVVRLEPMSNNHNVCNEKDDSLKFAYHYADTEHAKQTLALLFPTSVLSQIEFDSVKMKNDTMLNLYYQFEKLDAELSALSEFDIILNEKITNDMLNIGENTLQQNKMEDKNDEKKCQQSLKHHVSLLSYQLHKLSSSANIPVTPLELHQFLYKSDYLSYTLTNTILPHFIKRLEFLGSPTNPKRERFVNAQLEAQCGVRGGLKVKNVIEMFVKIINDELLTNHKKYNNNPQNGLISIEQLYLKQKFNKEMNTIDENDEHSQYILNPEIYRDALKSLIIQRHCIEFITTMFNWCAIAQSYQDDTFYTTHVLTPLQHHTAKNHAICLPDLGDIPLFQRRSVQQTLLGLDDKAKGLSEKIVKNARKYDFMPLNTRQIAMNFHEMVRVEIDEHMTKYFPHLAEKDAHTNDQKNKNSPPPKKLVKLISPSIDLDHFIDNVFDLPEDAVLDISQLNHLLLLKESKLLTHLQSHDHDSARGDAIIHMMTDTNHRLSLPKPLKIISPYGHNGVKMLLSLGVPVPMKKSLLLLDAVTPSIIQSPGSDYYYHRQNHWDGVYKHHPSEEKDV